MANRYWVGGNGLWNTVTTTNWSATPGGAGGASVPTSVDDVFFDTNSGSAVVTMASPACRNIDCTGFTGTLAGSGTWNLYGSVKLVAGMTYTSTARVAFNGTALTNYTLDFAGKTLSVAGGSNSTLSSGIYTLTGDVIFAGSAGGLSFSSNPTLDTNGYSMSISTDMIVGGTSTLTLGSSTITFTATSSSQGLNISAATATVNAGTSTLLFTGNAAVQGNGKTFNNITVSTAATGFRLTGAGTTVAGTLTISGSASAGIKKVLLVGNSMSIANLVTSGTSATNRVMFWTGTRGWGRRVIVTSSVTLSDCDFQDLDFSGSTPTISGTRIGNLGRCINVSFTPAKTAYWVGTSGGTWTSANWALTSGGAGAEDNFPLPQDTAVVDNAFPASSGSMTFDATIDWKPSVSFASRTNALSLTVSTTTMYLYGDFILPASGTTWSGNASFYFTGSADQTLTTSGTAFSMNVYVEKFAGTLKLGSAFTANAGTSSFYIFNGGFSTQNYSMTVLQLISTNTTFPRVINLDTSTITVSGSGTAVQFSYPNILLSASSSTINMTNTGSVTCASNIKLALGTVNFTGALSGNQTVLINGGGTYAALGFNAVAGAGLRTIQFTTDTTITGALTCSAPTNSSYRNFIGSNTLGTQRRLTIGSLAATDTDFQDIILAGAAAPFSGTRLGNATNNSGITFPSSKTVYWVGGTGDWSTATAWAATSGGAGATTNFPLIQDTAVFDDNSGGAGITVTLNRAVNVGNINSLTRTLSMTWSIGGGTGVTFYGDVYYNQTGARVSIPTIYFRGTNTQNLAVGSAFSTLATIVQKTTGASVVLQSSLTMSGGTTFYINYGGFDTNGYSAAFSGFGVNAASANASPVNFRNSSVNLQGTSPLSNASTTSLWYLSDSTVVFDLTNNDNTTMTISALSLAFGSVVLAGTGTGCTYNFSVTTYIGVLSSTRTNTFTLRFGSTTQYVGRWLVTGTAGNLIAVQNCTSMYLTSVRTSGIDYLAFTSFSVASTATAEFYAGVNSTGGTGTILTAAPAPRTLYWVGGAGNWSSTLKWATSSGGAGGNAIPTSADTVIFDSASNATAYTATIDANIVFASLSLSNPASGALTFSGSLGIFAGGNITISSGITWSHTGTLYLAGNSSATLASGGKSLSAIQVYGYGSTWSLGDALSASSLTAYAGTFNTNNYSLTVSNSVNSPSSTGSNKSTLTFGSSTVTAYTFTTSYRTSMNAGTSTIVMTGPGQTFTGSGLTYYNVSITGFSPSANLLSGTVISGANTFNNLSFTGPSTDGVGNVLFSANQTINGQLQTTSTLLLRRIRFASSTTGVQRTLTVAGESVSYVDFRDIAITGAGAPLTGTSVADSGGNSGITFTPARSLYWNNASSASWASNSWATTSGGSPDVTAFPLSQDTAVFDDAGAVSTVSCSTTGFFIGNVNCTARTIAMTLNLGNVLQCVCGDFRLGTGVTLTGTGSTMYFMGTGVKYLNTAGQTLGTINLYHPNVEWTLEAAMTSTSSIGIEYGTFNSAGYTVTLPSFSINPAATSVTGVKMGASNWVLTGGSGTMWSVPTYSTTTFTFDAGTSTITLLDTTASARSFSPGVQKYYNLVIGGTSGTSILSFTNHAELNTISTTKVNTPFSFVMPNGAVIAVNDFTISGSAGFLPTIGTSDSTSSFATFWYRGNANVIVDYISARGLIGYPGTNTWYVGTNSTNIGSSGLYFSAGVVIYSASILEAATGTETVFPGLSFAPTVSETATGSDAPSTAITMAASTSELGNVLDVMAGGFLYSASVLEQGTGEDLASVALSLSATIVESAAATEAVAALFAIYSAVSESATVSEEVIGGLRYDASLADTASGSDAILATQDYNVIVLESSSGADVYVVAPSEFNVSMAEIATGTDTPSAAAVFYAAYADTATTTDAMTAAVGFGVQILESSTTTDVFSALVGFSVIAAESAAATEQAATRASFGALVAVGATATDSLNAPGSNYTAGVIESVVGSDVFYGAFLWEIIDDSQTADWQNITDTQTPGWGMIDTGSNDPWSPISTT